MKSKYDAWPRPATQPFHRIDLQQAPCGRRQRQVAKVVQAPDRNALHADVLGRRCRVSRVRFICRIELLTEFPATWISTSVFLLPSAIGGATNHFPSASAAACSASRSFSSGSKETIVPVNPPRRRNRPYPPSLAPTSGIGRRNYAFTCLDTIVGLPGSRTPTPPLGTNDMRTSR